MIKRDSNYFKSILESVKHLRRAHSTAQEIFNYLSITLNKTKLISDKLKYSLLSEIKDRKKVSETPYICIKQSYLMTSLSLPVQKIN